MAVICVGLSFLSLPTLIDVNSTDAERQDATSSCIFMALCAVAVVYPPAKVTTACEDMKLMLNDLRTAGVGTGHGMIDQTTDADISVIETWLCNLNDGQGKALRSPCGCCCSLARRTHSHTPQALDSCYLRLSSTSVSC
jgi:hypothetical protein